MPTPIFKFQHPNIIVEDLYFIKRTLFELPKTIPMDFYFHTVSFTKREV
jgi:hypothetical protein